ncbi:hypothetical protein DWF00_05195 [Bosea caraganae]|uniref:Beta-lactamase-related domain-containing protein n=2 Tax=Bosea caraganae TaxID=2763117 RepID=A0A370L0B2_9HYPH|nr:hypothetical protein DWE98_23300 [Bosea caraganae]RDJ28948.1 hypothetical protein DWF00_05195 [Bosea caraganae]
MRMSQVSAGGDGIASGRRICRLFSFGGLALAASLAAAPVMAQQPTQAAIEALLPDLEKQVAAGMSALSVPGVTIGIVFDDKLIYSKAFGAKEAGKPDPVTPDTIFQIGSTTKAFFATTLAQAVDAGKLKWTDHVSDFVPAFQLADPFVSRDFRVLDIAAQRSGLTPYVNDGLAFLGFDKETLFRSMRAAPQTGIFRSDFRYLNIPHLAGGEIVAKVNGAESWAASVKRTLLDPLGMSSTTATAEAIAQAPNHAMGHRLDDKPVAIPFHAAFPYALGPAGAFNSNVPDMAKWLRLQLGRGQFGEKVIVSEENLDVTWTPRVAINERMSYAVGWLAMATPRGRAIWHNGGTSGFGAHVGFLPDAKTGIVILTNIGGPSLADALGLWFYDRVLGNPAIDNIALAAASSKKQREQEKLEQAAFVVGPVPANPAPFTGTYASPVLGDAVVSVVDGKLQAKLERTDLTMLLEANKDDPNLFQARLIPAGGYEAIVAIVGDTPFVQMRFERDMAGKITQLRWINPELPHLFTRQEP